MKFFKKFFLLGLVILVGLSLIACGEDKNNTVTSISLDATNISLKTGATYQLSINESLSDTLTWA